MKLTYREAYDRIVDSYMNDTLRPGMCHACFVGNLLGRSEEWEFGVDDNTKYKYRLSADTPCLVMRRISAIDFIKFYGYTPRQITDIENCFLKEAPCCCMSEDVLFEAMSRTLDMLKEIHEANGEVIDAPVFVKRQLENHCK